MATPASLKASVRVVRTVGQKYPVGTIVFLKYDMYELPDGTRKSISADAPVGVVTPPSNRAAFLDCPNFVG